MISSPDLLAFTGAEGFGEGGDHLDTQALPKEFSVPLISPFHPWTRTAQFQRDFILVAEFSEQVGPQPVLRIPDDPRVLGSFDLDHFSVRIMSVDYQAAYPGPVSSLSPGSRLNFTEDSKVVLGDSAEGAYAYVQHLTLYDLEARGLVRPFCMAYVSSDQSKLMEHFSELSVCFTQASDSLKTGNRRAFATELQRKLQELEYTRLTLQQRAELQNTGDESTDVGEKANELAALQCSILNYRDLLRQVTSYPNRKLKQPGFLPYDPAENLVDSSGLSSPVHPAPPSFSTASLVRRLKPLEELSDAYFLSLTLEQLADTERRLRGDRSAVNSTRLIGQLSRKLTLTNFLFELWKPEEDSEEDRGARHSGKESFPVAPPNLESFYSCVEELPIKLDAVEERTLTPEPEGAMMEMMGSVSSDDSIEVLGTEKSYQTQRVVTGDDNREPTGGKIDFCLKRAPAEACIRPERAYARRANSEDSIEVLSTTESIIPEDLEAITEEEPEYPLLDNSIQEKEVPLQRDEGTNCFLEKVTILRVESQEPENQRENEEKDSINREESSRQMTVCNQFLEEKVTVLNTKSYNEDGLNEERSPGKFAAAQQVEEQTVVPIDSASHSCQSGESVDVVPDLHVKISSAVGVTDIAPWPPLGATIRTLSIDETSTRISPSKSPPYTNSLNGNHHFDQSRRKAGFRALKFIQQNSFSQHTVFCLLSGRPLIVVGGDESSVRILVSALSLFLPAPGPDRNAVQPCLNAPLQLTDLLTWRLIGVHRTPSATSAAVLHSLARYRRYLALLDLDQKTLRCPSYSGSLIGRIAHSQSSICRGSTYLLHLESCLTALAHQALLFTFHQAIQRSIACDRDDAVDGKDILLERGICKSEDDLRVMRFLSDLFKHNLAGHGPPFLRFSYRPAQIHKNTTTT